MHGTLTQRAVLTDKTVPEVVKGLSSMKKHESFWFRYGAELSISTCNLELDSPGRWILASMGNG